MGTDIHAIIERKYYLDDERKEAWGWENAGCPGNDRYYDRFAALCGIRDYADEGLLVPIAEPRGLPKDASRESESALDIRRYSVYAESWVTLAELKAARPRFENWRGGGHNPLDEWIAEIDRIKRPGETDDDLRVVFGFDS